MHQVIERNFVRMGEHGPEYSSTYTGKYAYDSLDDWLAQRRKVLGRAADGPLGRIALGLLDAARGGDDRAIASLVKSGRRLDAWDRFRVARTLDQYRQIARGELDDAVAFPEAVPVADKAFGAWKAAHGYEMPPAASLPPGAVVMV